MGVAGLAMGLIGVILFFLILYAVVKAAVKQGILEAKQELEKGGES